MIRKLKAIWKIMYCKEWCLVIITKDSVVEVDYLKKDFSTAALAKFVFDWNKP